MCSASSQYFQCAFKRETARYRRDRDRFPNLFEPVLPKFFPTPVGTPGGKPLRLTARVKIARSRDPIGFGRRTHFLRLPLLLDHHRLPPPRPHRLIAYSAFSGIHSDSHSGSTHAFAPPREVATRRFRQPIADIGHVKGWLHWRLLGALTAGDARAAYSRRIVAPSSSLRRLLFSARAAPAPLRCAQAVNPIQSITHSSALSLRTGPPRPLVHRATALPRSAKEKGSGG